MSEPTLKDGYFQDTRRILEEFCDAAGCDIEQLLETGHLQMQNVHFGLIHYGELDPDALTLTVDLGPISYGREAQAYRLLLEQNIIFPSALGSYGINPKNGHGALILRLDLVGNKIDGRLLVEIMSNLVDVSMMPTREVD